MNNRKKRWVSLGMFFVLTATTFLSSAGSFTANAGLIGNVNNDTVVDVRDLVSEKTAETAYKSNKSYNEKYDIVKDGVIDKKDLDRLRKILLGIYEDGSENEEMIAVSAWAYGDGSLDNSKTCMEKGYEYATVITGSNDTYGGRMMMDVDLSRYSSFRFALKSDGNAWYEIGKTADHSFGLLAKNDAEWVEIEFKDEGNDCFQGFVNGAWVNVRLPLNTNLSDLQMKFGTSGTLVVTEVRGTLRDGVGSSLAVVAGSFNTKEGTEVKEERPILEATGSTRVSTTWEAAESGLTALKLAPYKKILFYARKTGADHQNGWFESVEAFGQFVITDSWTEFKMVKNEDDTWNLYRAGMLVKSNQSLTDLSDITAKYGTDTYYFSEVFGEGGTEEPEAGEKMAVVSAWAYGNGSLDNSKTYMEKGYEYATVITGSNDTYGGRMMMDVDLSGYSSFRFALKSDGNAWYEIGKTAEQSFDLLAKNDATWVEIEFKDEGNDCFQGFVNGEWKNVRLPLNTNLSDLQMKFGTSGTLVVTEVRGTLRENFESSLTKAADSSNDAAAQGTTSEKAIYESSGSVLATPGWQAEANRYPLHNLDLSNCTKVLFYAKRVDDASGKWFESTMLGSFEMKQVWTEFKLVKNADGTWNIYVAGKRVQQNIALSNLNEIKVSYGDGAQYYFSELFAVFQ